MRERPIQEAIARAQRRWGHRDREAPDDQIVRLTRERDGLRQLVAHLNAKLDETHQHRCPGCGETVR